MRVVTIYSKSDCPLCEKALETLRSMQSELAFTIEQVDITADEALHRAYLERVPVIALDGEELSDYFVEEATLRKRLGASRGADAARGIL